MPTPRSNPAPWVLLTAAALLAICAGQATAAGATAASPPSGPSVQWTTATPTASPPPLANAAAAYDADTSTLVLFGGVNSRSHTLSNQTWIWSGFNWSEATMNGQQPPARQWASMAFDPTLHALILFGGETANGTLLNDTWAWTGASWYQIPVDSSPEPRAGAAMAFDRAGDLVLFGGTGYGPGSGDGTTTTLAPIGSPTITLSDTWEWTSGGWQQAPTQATAPPARAGAVISYDGANQSTVMFAGSSTPSGASPAKLLGDTWTWNGGAWASAKAAHSPSARTAGVADYFPGLHGPLVLGGQGANGALADAWVWSGSDWVQAKVVGADPARAGGAGAYDGRASAMTVFGGSGSTGSTLDDTGLATFGFIPSSSTTTSTLPATTATSQHPTTTVTGSTSSTSPGGRPSHTPTVTRAVSPTTLPRTGLSTATTRDGPARGASGPHNASATRHHHKVLSSAAQLSLVGLAILVPVAFYGGLEGLGLLRRRQATSRANGPRSPS